MHTSDQTPPTEPPDPIELFGELDIYLFDQLLRGRVAPGMRVLDVGCGAGRNLRYFLRSGYDVAGCDQDPDSIQAVRRLAEDLAPRSVAGEERFRLERIEASSFEARSFDFVICNAVLHFARDHAHFRRLLRGAWSKLRPGGVCFVRLASSIGIEDRLTPLGGGRCVQPDGKERYLVDQPQLEAAARELGAELLDPLKTTHVQDLRCMTTWVLRRGSRPESEMGLAR